MAATPTRPPSSSSSSSIPPPYPKSPPQYPDLYGKRRQAAKLQMLDREIGFLEEELKSTEGLQPASKCCKEVADYVIANSDPMIPTYKKHRRRCQFWKWLCNKALPKIWLIAIINLKLEVDSPVVSYPGFAVAVMLDARSISKSLPAATVITLVNAYRVAAVNYRSGCVVGSVVGSVGIVALVQHYPNAHALVQPSHAANVVAIFHYLPAPAQSGHAVNANANANAQTTAHSLTLSGITLGNLE
ncbi:guanine nucleotide-binding protein subunit gamma 3-like [Cucumis melo var. makuwa]|uniref:Guanine nucleotide-binding protein subunit gamma 3-like n=1 Tax=Cucumis melo var. makuwa TaxID=1194695 RepID=A0A5A7UZX5_CUCMM|nr:guanine nucleotide-binding protein subunit gamma 3-like [Cucumis melo var. makuwa]TYK10812.1 guanine nucleotide-binding protein subunit gamma 3-like [Cucumis melo var. makuwa]